MKLYLRLEVILDEAGGITKIMQEIERKLDFITNDEKNLEEIENYGTEFKEIFIISSCISKEIIEQMEWKERRYISRKEKSADIRLHIDYEKFMSETLENKKLIYIKNIIDSIDVVISRSKGDFRGEDLKRDILKALDVTQEQLDNI